MIKLHRIASGLQKNTKQKNRNSTISKIQWLSSHIPLASQNPNNPTINYPRVCVFKSIMPEDYILPIEQKQENKVKKKTPGTLNLLGLLYNNFFFLDKVSFP